MHLAWPVTQLELELLLHSEGLGVDAVERGGFVTVGAALVAAVCNRPHFVVAVHDQRCRLYADLQFIDNSVRLGVDFDDAVLVTPAVAIDVFAVLHHLLRRAAFHRHVRHLDMPGDFIRSRIYNEDAVVPQLGDIGFLVAQEMDIARGGQILDASHLLEGVQVDGENHDPALVVVDGHRLCHVAELHAVGTEEDLVLHLFGLWVVVAQRGVAVLEVALVGNEQSGSRGVEILHGIAVVPLHAGG